MASKDASIFDSLAGLACSSMMSSAAVILAIVALTLGMLYVVNRPKKLNLPVVGKEGQVYYGDDVLEGVQKYPNTPFVIPLNPPMVILPRTVIEEVRNLPESKVSFNKSVARNFLSRHTGIGEDRPDIVKAVKNDLTRYIASTLDDLQDEIRFSLDKELGECKEWTAVTLYPAMANIVSLLSGRVFVGRPLSRSQAWIDASVNYTMDAVSARYAISKWPVIVRDIVAPFLPEVKGVKRYGSRLAKQLDPILQATLAGEKSEKRTGFEGDNEDEQGTFISWVLKYTNEKLRKDPKNLAQAQMTLNFAAIHTSTMALTQTIFDLIARREYIQPLRDEIQQVVDEDGHDTDGDGFFKLKKSSLPKLKKLDSFMKECQRVTPGGVLSNLRLVTSDLTLSTGHTLPKGTRFGLPAHTIHTSASTLTYSPEYNPDSALPPSEFDGFRFANLRAMPGKETRHQFVTTSSDSLAFGYGNHQCPGRFFASNEIKVVLIELLRNWEFRIKGDVEMKGGMENRPKNHFVEFSIIPDGRAQIEFKRRGV